MKNVKRKPKDCVDIADKKINKKLLDLVATEKKKLILSLSFKAYCFLALLLKHIENFHSPK